MSQIKIKIINGLLLTDIATAILVAAATIAPSSIVRIILGIPLMLFFPGYVLVSALMTRKENSNQLEKIALSIGLSAAISALIGYGLNYTSGGITLTTGLYSISAFIILVSIIALIRTISRQGWRSLLMTLNFTFPGWGGGPLSKSLTVALVVALLGSIGTLGYISASDKSGEQFTEFYILGIDGQAQYYPSQIIMLGNTVSRVSYGGEKILVEPWARTTIGITNRNKEEEQYSIALKIDGQQASFYSGEAMVNQISEINLLPNANWEQEIRFVPLHAGDSQKVEFILTRANNPVPVDILHLWVDVTISR